MTDDITNNIRSNKKDSNSKTNSSKKNLEFEHQITQINNKELEQIPINKQECQYIIDSVSERLSCFTLLGFDYAGNPVSICVVQTQLQDMALTSLVSTFSDKLQFNQLEADNPLE